MLQFAIQSARLGAWDSPGCARLTGRDPPPLLPGSPGRVVADRQPASREAGVGSGPEEIRADPAAARHEGRLVLDDRARQRLAADAAPANEGQGQGRGALNVWLLTLHQPMRDKDKVGGLKRLAADAAPANEGQGQGRGLPQGLKRLAADAAPANEGQGQGRGLPQGLKRLAADAAPANEGQGQGRGP